MTRYRHCRLQNLHMALEVLHRMIPCMAARCEENGLSEAEEGAVENSGEGGCHDCVCSRCSMAAGTKASFWTFSLNLISPSWVPWPQFQRRRKEVIFWRRLSRNGRQECQ